MATILMITITVVIAALIFVLIEGYTRTANAGPNLGGSLAIAPPTDAVSESASIAACSTSVCNFYNMTVQSAASTLELHNLQFEVQAPNGTNFAPTGGLVALNASGGIVGQYAFLSGWTSGGVVSAQSHLTLVLYTSGAHPLSLFGDYLEVYGVSGFTGSISVHID